MIQLFSATNAETRSNRKLNVSVNLAGKTSDKADNSAAIDQTLINAADQEVDDGHNEADDDDDYANNDTDNENRVARSPGHRPDGSDATRPTDPL